MIDETEATATNNLSVYLFFMKYYPQQFFSLVRALDERHAVSLFAESVIDDLIFYDGRDQFEDPLFTFLGRGELSGKETMRKAMEYFDGNALFAKLACKWVVDYALTEEGSDLPRESL